MTTSDQPDLEAQVAAMSAQLEACCRQLLELHQLTAIGHLLAGIVHEINTPVGSILSNHAVSSRSLDILGELPDQAAGGPQAPAAESGADSGGADEPGRRRQDRL